MFPNYDTPIQITFELSISQDIFLDLLILLPCKISLNAIKSKGNFARRYVSNVQVIKENSSR